HPPPARIRRRAADHRDGAVTAAREPNLVVATTRRVPDPGDLLDALGSGGFAWFAGAEEFVTAGAVATVAAGDAGAFLRSIERSGDPGGRGVRAVGALPFRDADAGRLVVPARLVERDAEGRVWSTTVEPASAAGLGEPSPRGRIARRFTVEARQ